jgi:hypothetical protein
MSNSIRVTTFNGAVCVIKSAINDGGDEPLNPPETPKECPNKPECNTITCTKCGESYCSTHETHECENISSGDHGTGYCAKCWESGDDYNYKGNLETHGHSDIEVYDYTLALKFENNDNDIVTIYSDYETHETYKIFSDTTGDFDSDNGDKNSIYNFTWKMNHLNRVIDDEAKPGEDDSSEPLPEMIHPSLRYDLDKKKWVISFECSGQNAESGEYSYEFCKVYLGDGKTPLGMKANLESGTVEVIINE